LPPLVSESLREGTSGSLGVRDTPIFGVLLVSALEAKGVEERVK
jgi:hypothetical protein